MSKANHDRKLSDLFTFKNGRAFKKTEWSETGLPIIRIQNLNDSSKPFNRFNDEYDPAIEINFGDLLFSWSGTVGSSFGPHIWDREKGVLNQHIYKISLKEQTNRDYAFYSLLQITSDIEKKVRGAVGLVHVKKTDLKEFTIPHPPLAEQKRIVSILDEAFAAIAKAKENAERNLANAKELFESYLNKVFSEKGEGWEERKFGDLTVIRRGHNPPKSQFVYSPQEGYVRFWQIRDGSSDKDAVYVPESPKLHRVKETDILMVAYRHIGRRFRGASGAFNVALCCITNANESVLNTDYLFHLIPTSFVRGELLKRSERSLIPSMSVKHLAELMIPIPTLDEQSKIVACLEEFNSMNESLCQIYRQQIADLDELKQSILQKAFTGQLTSKSPELESI